MGESLGPELEDLTAGPEHPRLAGWPFEATDHGHVRAFGTRLGLERGSARLWHRSHNLIVVAARDQGFEELGLVLERFACRSGEGNPRCLDQGPHMGDSGELLDVADKTIRHIDGCLGKVPDQKHEIVARQRPPIAPNDKFRFFIAKAPESAEPGLLEEAKAEMSVSDRAGHIKPV